MLSARGKIWHFNKSENKQLRLPTPTGASRKARRPHFVSKCQKKEKISCLAQEKRR